MVALSGVHPHPFQSHLRFAGDPLSDSVASGNGMGQHYTDPDHPVVRHSVQIANEIAARDILDLGSGRGNTVRALAVETAAKRIVATDINEAGLSELQDWADTQQKPVSTTIFNAASNELPQPWRGSFDLVVAKDLYPFLTPTQTNRFIRNAHDALKPGGWFVLTAPSTRSELYQKSLPAGNNPFYRRILQGAKDYLQTTLDHFTFVTIGHLAHKLKRFGFEMTEAEHFGRQKGWITAVAQKTSQPEQ